MICRVHGRAFARLFVETKNPPMMLAAVTEPV
jgi:hypothetical protein